MEKIVVLNSGGFDSTTLLAELACKGEYEIHSLYFDYGQLNSLYDSKCAFDNVSKLGAVHHKVVLPRFSWTNNEFYSESSNEYSSQYLEMRNVIFISYALSLAESIGATSIYAAILGNGAYKDTNAQFLEKMRDLCENLGFEFITPYSELEKSNLFYLAKKLGVGTELKYISCDTPDLRGNPCGKCADCKSLEDFECILNNKYAIQYFYEAGINAEDEKFQEAFRSEPIQEMRVVLNNSCQLHCEHCYHGDNELIDDILTDKELIDTILEARDLGIKSIHFAGKEPLFDDRIFRIIEGVKNSGVNDIDFTVVTNGINVPKYADEIKKSGISKVFLSADDEYSGEENIRHNAVNAAVKRAVLALNGVVPVEIFLDLTPHNIKNVIHNIRYWETYNVKDFHIRTIRPLGNAKNMPLLSIEEICLLHHELKKYNSEGVHINLDIGVAPYTYDILSSEDEITTEIKCDLDKSIILNSTKATENYNLLLELFCNRYLSQITLTADGYILGCGMECSVKNYDKTSPGSVRCNSLDYLIKSGKEQSLEVNRCQCNSKCLNFEKCVFTPIDN